jgi:outer membrane protein TolC
MNLIFRKFTLTALLFTLGLTGLLAQSPRVISLDEAIGYALNENVAIKNAQINIANAEQQIIERRSFGIPQLNADVSYQRYLKLPPLPPTFDSFGAIFELLPDSLGGGMPQTDGEASIFFRNTFTLGLNLDAMIFDGSYFTGLQAAKAYRQYVDQEMQIERREVKNKVINAYLPVLLLNENIQLMDKNIDNLEKLHFETSELYKAGFAEQLDIDRLELSLTNLKVEKENLLRQKQVAIANLKFSMGYPVDEEIDVIGDLESMTIEAAESDLVAAVNFSNRPEYGLMDKGIHLNELNIRFNRSGYLPSLRAFGAYQYAYQGNNSNDGFWAPTSYIGARLSIPIFDGLMRKAQVQRARLDLEMVKVQRDELMNAIKLEVTNARTNYLNATERLEAQKRNLSLAQRIYDTTQIKYREGVGSSLEVTQAEQSLYTTQSNYMQALYDLVAAHCALLQALGK